MNATRQTIDRLAKTWQELKPLKAEYQQRLDKKDESKKLINKK